MIPHNAQKFARMLGCNPDYVRTLNGDIRAADFLRRAAALVDDDAYGCGFKEGVVCEGLGMLLEDPSSRFRIFESLYSARILPTPAVVSFILQHNTSVLESIIDSIKSGHFDGSDLHKELEFSRYQMDGGSISFDSFRKLPELGQLNLGVVEYRYADKAVEDALEVYSVIKAKANDKTPLLVIGNKRYGSLFVIEPLKDFLEDIKVVFECIFSTYSKKGKSGFLDKDTWKYIAENNPNVIVVDGTGNSVHNGFSRFPAAMWGYIEAFKAYNDACGLKTPVTEAYRGVDKKLSERLKKDFGPSKGYSIDFWCPDMLDRWAFLVGDDYCHPLFDHGGERELLIVSSKHAHFDDFDVSLIKNLRQGFSESGYCTRPLAENKDVFVKEIQDYMKERIAERIKVSSR